MLCGVSFAQNANYLREFAGGSSNVSFYGPYYAGGENFWVARIEPEKTMHVLSESGVVRDPQKVQEITEVHGAYLLSVERSGFRKYLAVPAKLALKAEDALLGSAGFLVPFAFGAEKMLVGVSGAFLPAGVYEAVGAAEGLFTSEIELDREALQIYSAGWDARLALENVRTEMSYESASAYLQRSGLVINRSLAFVEKTNKHYGKMDALADAGAALSGFPGSAYLGNAQAVKDGFRAAGGRSAEKVVLYSSEFCQKPLCEK